jgi:CheY-like chemotaxis protein
MARILVIEHDLNLLNLISSVLRQDGHTVTETSDPTEALAIAERQPKDFDLILTDVELHPISGFEFVRRLTIKGIHIPTQFMSERDRIDHRSARRHRETLHRACASERCRQISRGLQPLFKRHPRIRYRY